MWDGSVFAMCVINLKIYEILLYVISTRVFGSVGIHESHMPWSCVNWSVISITVGMWGSKVAMGWGDQDM